MADDVVVKRAPLYPVDASVDLRAGATPGKIKKLTRVGFLIEMAGVVVVGKNLKVRFEVPVSQFFVEASVKVIKTYDSWGGGSPAPTSAEEASASSRSQTVVRLVEMHFTGLSQDAIDAITAFSKLAD